MKRFVSIAALMAVAGCAGESTAPTLAPRAPRTSISDAVHSGGTMGFYFLPPMVSNPASSGAFDPDLVGLDPQVTICDLSAGVNADCGGSTPSLLTLTRTSSPAISVDSTALQYQVNWDTKGSAFVAGHTYRIHVMAGVAGARRELGYADILLTTTPGQAKNVSTDDVIVLSDGRTLPIKFRVERGILGSLAVDVTPTSLATHASGLATVTVRDLHAAPLANVGVVWSATGTPVTLATPAGTTDVTGTHVTGVTAGSSSGSASITVSANGLSASASLIIVDPNACIAANPGTPINTPASTGTTLFVTSQDGQRVTAYGNGSNGDAVPVTTIEGPSTGLSAPQGIARDAAGNLYVANFGTNAITVYANGASGDAAPFRVIQGANTQINGPEGLAVDGAGMIYVANQIDHRILVFAAGDNGNVAPVRRIMGSCTNLNRPIGIALDAAGHLYVANLGAYTPSTSSITVYGAGASGNTMPLATIAGGSTGLYNPLGIAVDANGTIYVSNFGNTDAGPSNFATAVTVYAAAASGDVAPIRTITGTMSEPLGLALDMSGQLYVANFAGQHIAVFGAGANGAAPAIAVISGPNTRLNRPSFLTF